MARLTLEERFDKTIAKRMIKLNYIAPVTPGRLDAEASVLAITNRSAVVRGEAYTDGQIVCAAQGTISIVVPRTAPTP